MHAHACITCACTCVHGCTSIYVCMFVMHLCLHWFGILRVRLSPGKASSSTSRGHLPLPPNYSLWSASPTAVLSLRVVLTSPDLACACSQSLGPLMTWRVDAQRSTRPSPVMLLSPRSPKDRTTQVGLVSPGARHIFLVRWRLPGCPTNRMPLGTEIFTYTCKGGMCSWCLESEASQHIPPPRAHHQPVSPLQKPCPPQEAPFPVSIRTDTHHCPAGSSLLPSAPQMPQVQLPFGTKTSSRAASPCPYWGMGWEGPLHQQAPQNTSSDPLSNHRAYGIIIELCGCACARICVHACVVSVCLPMCMYASPALYTRVHAWHYTH